MCTPPSMPDRPSFGSLAPALMIPDNIGDMSWDISGRHHPCSLLPSSDTDTGICHEMEDLIGLVLVCVLRPHCTNRISHNFYNE